VVNEERCEELLIHLVNRLKTLGELDGVFGNFVVVYLTTANLLGRNLLTGRLLGRRFCMRLCVCFVGLKLFYIVERMGLTSHD
jgi:hypothetical protein